jgi:hypothetical protein
MHHQTEKNLFLVVCALFVVLATTFAIMLAAGQPDAGTPGKSLPGKPVVESQNRSAPANDAAIQAPPQNLPSFATSTIGERMDNESPRQPEAPALQNTGSIKVEVIGRAGPKPLFCRLLLEDAELYQVELKDGSCRFYNLNTGRYQVELHDGIAVLDTQAVNLENGLEGSLLMTASKIKTFCRDSDNGLTYDQLGITMDQFGNEFSDLCISDRVVREYYCEDNQLKQSDTTCNTACMGGVCK